MYYEIIHFRRDGYVILRVSIELINAFFLFIKLHKCSFNIDSNFVNLVLLVHYFKPK